MGAATPYRTMAVGAIAGTDALRKRDEEFYSDLTGAGFLLDHGDDGSGLGLKYMRRGSGYYIDVGGSQLIIDGEIKLQAPGAQSNPTYSQPVMPEPHQHFGHGR